MPEWVEKNITYSSGDVFGEISTIKIDTTSFVDNQKSIVSTSIGINQGS